MERALVWDQMAWPVNSAPSRGRRSDLRGGNGRPARVAVEAGATQPRTAEDGAMLTVSLHPANRRPHLHAFELAIVTHRAVFISRSGNAHDSLPMAYQYKNVPMSPTSVTDVAIPMTDVGGLGRFPPF